MESVWNAPWFPWAIGVGIGLPLAMVILGELGAVLERRRSPLAGPLGTLQRFVLPTLAAILWMTQVAGWSRENLGVKLATTAFWIVALVAALSLFNALVFSSAGQDTWRGRMPRIFTDVARLVLIGAGLAITLSSVWGFDVGGLVTAIGLTSLVIGLTLQNSVGGIITGLLLLFEQPFRIGDWLEIGGQIGRVVQINWRAIHLDTGSNLQIVPNSSLASSAFGNVSRNPVGHAATVKLRFTLKDAPNAVKKVLHDVATSLPSALLAPGPEVQIAAIEGDAITYATTIYLSGYEQIGAAQDQFLTRAWYAIRRNSLTLVGGAAYLTADQEHVKEGLRRAAPTFRVGAAQLEDVAARTRLQRFTAGETIVRQGERPEGLRLVVSGDIQLRSHDPGVGDLAVLDLAAGDTFGEAALTGEASAFTIVALGDVEALLFDNDDMHALMATTPRLTQQLGETTEQRRSLRRTVVGAARAAIAAPSPDGERSRVAA